MIWSVTATLTSAERQISTVGIVLVEIVKELSLLLVEIEALSILSQ